MKRKIHFQHLISIQSNEREKCNREKSEMDDSLTNFWMRNSSLSFSHSFFHFLRLIREREREKVNENFQERESDVTS